MGFNDGLDPLTCSLAAFASALLGVSPEARALPITMQDDALLLHRTPAQVHATAQRMASLGVDRVRLTAGWSVLAPRPNARRAPRFDARNSRAYPSEPWLRLDRAVRAVAEAGMEPQIDVAFFAPRWAVQRVVWSRHAGRHRWEPDTKRFARFTHAVAKRYDGTHPDPARPGRRLPAVRLWTTWNEPNHAAFLLPQWRRAGGRWVPRSPHLYRRLHERAYAAIKGVSASNRVLVGGLSAESIPGRGARKGLAPLHFLREFACVDRRLRPLDRPECEDFEPIQGDGFSQHPYSLYSAPDVPSRERDYGRMGDMGKLTRLLDALAERGRIASRLPVYITEYGYETNPPDVVRGVSLRAQARYHGLATYMAWRQPGIASFAQFLLHDIPPPEEEATPEEVSRDWHSGLYFHDGRAKPAVQAFKMPFWAEARTFPGQDVVMLFGQVRPGGGNKRVEIEARGPDGIWRAVRTLETRTGSTPACEDSQATAFVTDPHGFFLRIAAYEGKLAYRARWIRADGSSERSVPIRVGEPEFFPTTP